MSPVRSRVCPFDLSVPNAGFAVPAPRRAERPKDSKKAGSLPDWRLARVRSLPSHPVLSSPQAHRPSRRHPRTAGTSTSAATAPPRAGPSTTDSSPNGSSTAVGSPTPCRAAGPTSRSTSCFWPTSRSPTRYYVKNGKPTTEPASIRRAIRPLRKLYGHTSARDFGPLALKAVRQAMIDSGLCRNEVNKRVGQIVRAFKWAVGEEMVPPSVHHGLQAVSGLRRGRADVRESDPVKPVPEAFVEAIRPHVSRQVWAMVELQRLTGMRPGEVCLMRSRATSTRRAGSGSTRPPSHKTEHHGRERRSTSGPRPRTILRPWLRPDLRPPFSPGGDGGAVGRASGGRKTP